MRGITAQTEKISQVAAWFSGGLLFLASILIAVEVIARKVFSYSIGGADELSSYVLAISCTWGFSYALFRKTHIRIDVFYSRMPKPARHTLDILAHVLLGGYLIILCYFAFFVVKTSVVKHSAANTPLATPLWIPQSIWLAGLIWFGFSIAVLLFGTLYFRAKGQEREADQLLGIATLEEEIQESAELNAGSGETK
ncbi:MAG: TRAP transporter small permease [Desulfobacterales bacterium]|nr:TRAP transporter small permease [Deltaproteobacteria bacterium]NNK96968.1 TRAP transporter small permease [Desulfobacterales bacterium]